VKIVKLGRSYSNKNMIYYLYYSYFYFPLVVEITLKILSKIVANSIYSIVIFLKNPPNFNFAVAKKK